MENLSDKPVEASQRWCLLPLFFIALLFLSTVASAASIHSHSFNHSTATLSFNVSLNATNDSAVLPPSIIESFSDGEFTLASPFSMNFSLNQSALLQVNAASPVFSASGGLAEVVEDGCTENIGGSDLCELRGYNQPGDFHWCSPCDYFNPNCGNYLLHDWCYRYRSYQSHAASTELNTVSTDFSISITANNFSCAVTPSSNCSQPNFSTALINYSTNFSQPEISLIEPLGSYYWQSFSPSFLQAYSDALAYYNSHYFVSIPDAASSTAYLNSALSALLQNASGNYSDSFNYSPVEQAVFPNLSVSLQALAFNFTPLYGRPEILAVNSSSQSDGNQTFFSIPLKNAGFKNDNFSLDASCNDSSNYSLSAEVIASETAAIKLFAVNFTPARDCVLFASAAGNQLLNDSADVFFEAFVPQCPQEFECCSAQEFQPRPCDSAVLFNESGGYYYQQDYACLDFSCIESDSSFLYYPPQQPSPAPPTPPAPPQQPASGGSSSSGSAGSLVRFEQTPSPTLAPPTVQGTALTPQPLVFTSVEFQQEASEPEPLPPTASATADFPESDASLPLYSATAFFPFSAPNLRFALLFLACSAVALLSYALSRKLVFSKRFSNGRVTLRFENRSNAIEKIFVKDFVPSDAVFSSPPYSLDDTILGRLAEWRVGGMPADSFLEISYSCPSPAQKPASAEFSRQGKRFSLRSS